MKNTRASAALLGSLLMFGSVHALERSLDPVARETIASATSPSIQNPALDQLSNSPLWQGYSAAIKDLTPMLADDGDIRKALEHLENFEFAPETKKKLFELFGKENPLQMREPDAQYRGIPIEFGCDPIVRIAIGNIRFWRSVSQTKPGVEQR